jgi:hypothetical protein
MVNKAQMADDGEEEPRPPRRPRRRSHMGGPIGQKSVGAGEAAKA